MKRKSRRCSTGHGTGTIMPKTISPARRMGALAVCLDVDEIIRMYRGKRRRRRMSKVRPRTRHAMTAHMRNELFRLYT